MSSRSRSEVRPSAVDLPRRSRTLDLSQKGSAETRLAELEPRPHSFRASGRDSTESEASNRQEQSPVRTDSSASNVSASAGTLVENFPGRARWHQEEASRAAAMNTRTLSSESDRFASVARKGVGQGRKDDMSSATGSVSMPQIPSSPLVAHEPTRAKRFVGRPSSRETATIDDGFLSSPSRPRASAGWQNTLSNIEDQELGGPQSDSILVSQSSTDSKTDENLSKAERIAQYKEKRRKELASMFGGVQKAASFDTADIRGDGASYMKYRRSSSREDNRTPVDKIPPPVATVSPMVTGTYSTGQSQVQASSQYPMVTVMSPSTPLKVTADVGTSTSSVGTQTPSPTGLKSTNVQSKPPTDEVFSPPTTRRMRRDRSPLKSIHGAVNLPTLDDRPEVRTERTRRVVRPEARADRSLERSRVLSPERTRVLSPNTTDSTTSNDRQRHRQSDRQQNILPDRQQNILPDRQQNILPDRSRLLSPASDSGLSQSTTRTLTPVGQDGAIPKERSRLLPQEGHERLASPAERDVFSPVSSERSRLLSPTVGSLGARPSSVTLEPLSSLLPPRNVSRPSSTTPQQSQMLDIPHQPPRPSSAASKPDHRHIIRPQPIRAGIVQRSESSPSKMMTTRSRSDRTGDKSLTTASLATSQAATPVLYSSGKSSDKAVSSPQQSAPSTAATTPASFVSSASSTSIATSIPTDTRLKESHKEQNTLNKMSPSNALSTSATTSAASATPSSTYSSNPSGLAISSHLSSLLSSTNTSAIPSAKMAAQPDAAQPKKETKDSTTEPKSGAVRQRSSHQSIHPSSNIQTTPQPPPKSSKDDSQETVQVLESHKPVTAKIQPKSKEYRPLNQPEQLVPQAQTKAQSKAPSQTPSQAPSQTQSQSIDEEIKAIDSSKPKLRPLFTREDSFNRPDSPPRQPIPLPKNSVIARNRRYKVSSSSSSEVTPTPSPITSPRMSRRRGPRSDAELLLSPPTRRHRQGKSRSRAAKKSPGRPLKEGQGPPKEPHKEPVKETPVPKESHRSKSPTKQRKSKPETKEGKDTKDTKEGKSAKEDSKMGQGHSGAATSPAIHGGGHSHAQLGHGHHNQVIGHADRSMTLPASGGTVPAYSQSQYQQHQYQQKSNVQPAALQTQISQASQSSQQNEDAQPQRHIERRMSDSSSATSASRRRYRKRDSSLDSTQLDPVTLRPKKNDKASARKSSLNQTELNSQDNGNRVREHTPISSDDGGESNKRRSRYDQIQSSHAKTGVAGLSLSPPPTPSGDPFPVTQEFVTERLSKSPSPLNAQEYPPVRSQPSGERPRNALSPPPTSDRSQVRSPEHVITPRDVTSPRRVLSPEPVSYNRPLSVQDPQHSTSKVNPGIALTRPKSQQDYRPLLSPQQMPVTQQEGRDPRHSGYGLQSSAYQNADVIQAYSPVISKTGPLSPVRSQHTDSAWSSQGPLSPTQRQSGPLSPTSYSQLPPPLQLVTSTMHDRSGISALSPMGRQGPLSPTSLSALSPNRLTSPTPLSPPLSPSIVTSPTRTVAPRQLPRSVSSETGPRSPVPAPVVFPSPRPLSPQPDVTKPKFVPYTSKDLEDAYKQKSSSAAAGKSQNVTQLQSQKLQTQQLQSKQPPQPQLQSQKPQLQQPQSVPLTVGQSKHETTEPSVKKPTSQAQPQLSQPQTLHKTQTPQSAIATQKTTVVQPTTVVTPVKQAAPHPPQEDLVVPQQAVTVSDVPKTSNEDVSDPKPEQRLSGDSEAKRVEAAINRLHRDRSTESPAREDVLPNLRRGSRDVSELVRRFSSDVSDREGSPGGHGNNHSNLPSNLPSNQQGNRGDASNPLLRRTPDRTQSFRQQRQMTPPDSFIRAKSFREKKNGGQDSVADEQLKAILKRRSQNIDEWEEKVAGQAAPVLDKVTEVETQRFESRFKSTHSPSPVPIDRELSSALQVRRAREERESSGSQRSSESESNTKTTLNVPRSTNKVIETVDKSDRVTQKETVPAENVAVKTEKVLVQQRKTTESVVKPEPIKSATAEVEIKTVESKLKVTSPASSSTSSSTSSSSSKTSTKTSSETSSSSEKTSTQSTTQSSEPDTDSLPSKVGNKPESSTVGRSAPAETKQDEPSNKSITQPTKQPITQPITQTVTQPVKQAITQPVKKMTNETTASIITVAPVKLATKEVAKTNIGVAAALPQVAQDKAQERVSSVQSLKLRPAMNDVTNLQRSSHRIELTRSESLQGQGCDRPPLRKTQTVDLGGLEGERVACNLPMEQVSSVRRRSVHSPTPESELQGAEKEAKRTSVAERIFQMETKVDDLYTPRSGTSGAMTPRVIKLRSSTGPSGTGSPRRGQEVAAPMTLTSTPEKVVSDQLMARLGDMALMQEAAVRRQQSQQKGPQDSRRRTQPVTLEEVQQASALESVESFRAEISKNADGNQFNKSKGIHHVYKSKGRESFPQPFHREKLKDRRKDKRYQTQPITTEELGDIPEMQPLVLPERPPRRTLFNLDLTSDSDIELDQLVQVNYSKLQGQTQEMRGQKNQQDPSDNTDTTDKDNSEAQDDLSKMSVMQKMSLFRKMEEHKTPDMTPRSKRRFLDRKKRLERSRTQPITEEELTQASELAAAENGSKDTQQENEETQDTQERDEENGEENERQNQNGGEDEIKMRSAVSSDNVSKMDLAEDGTIDELSRMSLAEKMKLFSESNKSSEEKETKRDAPVLRRKARRAQSRFKTQDTQPITVEEVEKAKISPLAVTMIKPPDPELLQNMSVRDQREFLTEYARANFRASGLFKQSSTEEPPASQKDQKKTAKEPEISSVSTASTVTPSTEATPNEKLTTDVTTTVTPSAVTSTVTTVETTVTTIDTPVTTPAAAGVTPQVTSAPSSGNESKSEKAGSKKEVMRKQRQKQIEQRLQDSSTEDETFDKIQRIKNEAIARRRRMMEMRKAGESRFHSQPVDGSQLPKKENGGVASEEEKPCGHVRHKTQPVTESEKASLNARPNSPNSRGSIHDRENDNDQGLAQLRQHGEEDWKKRVRGRDVKSVDFSHVKLRDKSKKQQPQPEPSQPTVDQRPKSIADRLSKLEISQETWKDRVEEKDVSQFTVEGKLNRAGKTTTPDSPLVARRKKIRAPLTRAHSSPLPLPIDSSETVSSELEDKAPTKIEVPEANDDEFQSFFSTQDVTAISEPIDVTVDDFDHIFMESEDMLPTTKKIRPQRKQRTTKNPLKTLAARDDIQSEYTEVRTDIADKELRRIKREQIAGTAGFAEEALAGLASKENFSKVNLRKTDSFGSSTPSGTSGKYEPFQEIMLLHVKGRRHCQVRLVEPSSSSLNSGDSFVLVTSDKVYVWIGEYCNIIEKSKATDVAAIIQQKRDLGCKCYQEPTVIYEKRQDSPGSRGFWDALGGKQEYQTPGPVEEDELYETYMTETNKVWMLDAAGETLVALEDYKGTVLPYALLNTKIALVFDFGSEFYVWTGKQVPFVSRKIALRLAREQFERGYDYSKFDINPFSPLITPENGGLPQQSDSRPEWALFGKVNENMETILFREKFVDWPDSSRLIKVKTESDDQKSEPTPELEPCDASKMIAVKNVPVDLLLDGSHIGRGQKWVDKTEGITREFEILTLSIQVWHILEYDHSQVEDIGHGQFHDGDTYVVRWHYMVSQASRTLKGQEARHSMTGRERCAYFFWQGRNSSINEKGASALMTVELDEERGPQVRVIQGKEPPYFVQLFKGRMITHLGKREDESTNSQGAYRMYLVRNELPKEAYLAEVRCNISNLRSRGVYLLLNVKTGICQLWIGCKTSTHTRDRGRELANNLVNKCPLEVGLHPKAHITITEVEEGKEKSEFWAALDSSHRSLYFSLLNVSKPCQFTMRIFTMSSVSGIFEATELLNPCRSQEIASPFPFIQSDLYRLSQPSLVMVDAGPEVWVWQGWWPEGTEDSENVKTGSAHSRFNTERKLALRTTISYCIEKFGKSGSKDRAFVTYAGLEPLSFTNLFPHWTTRDDVTDLQLKEGRHVGERRKVEELLVQLNKNNYAWSELQQHPLPEGVDPLRLESYLNDDEFLEMLGMPKEDFYNIPTWKQGNLKKTVGLF